MLNVILRLSEVLDFKYKYLNTRYFESKTLCVVLKKYSFKTSIILN